MIRRVPVSGLNGSVILDALRGGPIIITSWRKPVAVIVPLQTGAQVDAVDRDDLGGALAMDGGRLVTVHSTDIGTVFEELSGGDDGQALS